MQNSGTEAGRDSGDGQDYDLPVANTIDLHTHSIASDGLYPPAELVQLAKKATLATIALCDHDTTDGLDEAIEAGKELGVEVIPGIEVNTELPDGRGDAHVLGYFLEYGRPELQANIKLLRDARARRGERMVEKLRAAGFDITWERVREIAQGAVGRPHLARALIEKGYAASVSEAFDAYLGRGRVGYVPRYKITPEDAVRLIKSARGVPALAHPAHIPQLRENVLPSLLHAGLQGLECYYGDYDEATLERLLKAAADFGLVPTGGSDYHGPNMHPTPLGGRYVPPDALDRLRRTGAFNHKLPALPFALPEPTL